MATEESRHTCTQQHRYGKARIRPWRTTQTYSGDNGSGESGSLSEKLERGLARRVIAVQAYSVSVGGASRCRSAGFLAAPRASTVAAYHDSARRRFGVDGVAGAAVAAVNLLWERAQGWMRQSPEAALR